MRPKLAVAASALVLAVAMAGSSHAEMVTIEEYIGASIGQQIGDAIAKGEEFKNAKTDANAEFEQARAAFYARLTEGILGSAEEQDFAELLHDKDIYYLSLNVSEGVRSSAKRLNGLDALSGGAALDGGIAGWPADDLFDAWVSAVRRYLGATADGQLIFVFDPVTLKQAIDATQQSYDRYRKARDAQEFKRWRASRPLIVEPKADTPEQRADTYIRVVLHDAVEKAVAALPEADREPTRAKIAPWARRLRQAIIDYESTPITPDVVADLMKAWKYSNDDMAYFWQQLGDGKNLKGPAFVTAAVEALSKTQELRDLRQYDYRLEANRAVMEEALKEWALKRAHPDETSTLRYIHTHKPVRFGLIDYITLADLISSGHLAYEPPLPAFRRVGELGAAGAVTGPASAPAAPSSDAASGSDVASLPLAEGAEPTPRPEVKPGEIEDRERQASLDLRHNDASPLPNSTEPKTFGMEFSSLDTTIRSKFAISDTVKGVPVTGVAPNSPAANKGIQAGDTIVEINQEAVSQPDDLAVRMRAIEEQGRKMALLLIANAQGDTRFVVLPVN